MALIRFCTVWQESYKKKKCLNEIMFEISQVLDANIMEVLSNLLFSDELQTALFGKKIGENRCSSPVEVVCCSILRVL